MRETIYRDEAIEAVCDKCDDNKAEHYPNCKEIQNCAEVKALSALPSAKAEPTVIRSRTLMPTKDFKEWAKRIREVNPNAVVIPCDAEVVSAEAVHKPDYSYEAGMVRRLKEALQAEPTHGRLIDADALMEYCSNQKTKTISNNDIARFPTADVVSREEYDKMKKIAKSWQDEFRNASEIANKLSADRPHGQWISRIDNDTRMLECSVCGCRVQEENYRIAVGQDATKCPYCGAELGLGGYLYDEYADRPSQRGGRMRGHTLNNCKTVEEVEKLYCYDCAVNHHFGWCDVDGIICAAKSRIKEITREHGNSITLEEHIERIMEEEADEQDSEQLQE